MTPPFPNSSQSLLILLRNWKVVIRSNQLVVIVAMRFRSALSRKATASDSLGRKSQVLGFWGMKVARRRQESADVLRWINSDHATISCSWRPRLSRVVALRLGGLTETSVAIKHNNPQDKPVVLESHSLLSPTLKCDLESRTISQANIAKEICSITVKGLVTVTPPYQNTSHSLLSLPGNWRVIVRSKQLLVIVAMRFRSALSRKATTSDSLGRKSQVLRFWGMQVARRRQEPVVVLRWINAP